MDADHDLALRLHKEMNELPKRGSRRADAQAERKRRSSAACSQRQQATAVKRRKLEPPADARCGGDHATRDGLAEYSSVKKEGGGQAAAARRSFNPASSRFAGVRWRARDRRWNMRIEERGCDEGASAPARTYRYGSFGCNEEEAAARAYDHAAREIFGPDVHGSLRANALGRRLTRRLNFPTPAEVAKGGEKNYPSPPRCSREKHWFAKTGSAQTQGRKADPKRDVFSGPSHPDWLQMLVDSEKRAAKRVAAGQKTSPYHGVGWDKQKQVWVAELSLGFLDVHARRVGQFACEEEVSRIPLVFLSQTLLK
jgi:hypothetical protein